MYTSLDSNYKNLTYVFSSSRPTTETGKSVMPMIKTNKLISARNYLASFQQDGAEEDKEADSHEVIIAESISLAKFEKFCNSEPRLPVRIRLVEGKIEANEVTSRPHAQVAFRVAQLISTWNGQLNGMSEADIIVGPASMYIADSAIIPDGVPLPPHPLRCDSTGAPYPTMVVEVGFSESLPSLHRLAVGYFSARTIIQVYLAIKLYPRRLNGTRAMAALLYLRTSPTPTMPVISKSFGTAPLANSVEVYLRRIGVLDVAITGVGRHGAPACDAPGLPLYRVNVPAVELFHCAPAGVPAAAADGFDLDLWILQNLAH